MRAGGFVLTGGRSTRMGADKALLPYRGVTLAEWVAGQVREAVGNVALVGSADLYGHLGIPCIAEAYGGCGPMSGIEAALRSSALEWNLVVACDMPGLDSAGLALILAEASRTDSDAVVVHDGNGRIEPLCAVYHRRLLPMVQGALECGEYTVRKLLEKQNIRAVRSPWEANPGNINTPEEWAAWSR